jgi:hypothetical protein
MFREAGYPDAHRGWQARAGTDDPDIVGVTGYWIECRCRDYISIPDAICKAMHDRSKQGADKYRWIAVIGKRTHRAGKRDPLPVRFVAMPVAEAHEFVDAVAKSPNGPPTLPVSFDVRSSGGLDYAVFALDVWFAGVALLQAAPQSATPPNGS